MRIILYLVDGVSGCKIPSLNSDYVNKHYQNEVSFFDEMASKGWSLSRCYGCDTTQASLYSLFTGEDITKSEVTQSRHADFFLDFKTTLAGELRKQGWKTTYISNNYTVNKGIIFSGFQNVFHFHEEYSLKKILEHNEVRDCALADKSFVFYHDFYTHDQNGQYSKGKSDYSKQEYHDLILEHSEIVRENLDTLKFDETQDVLVLFSDHGMTVDSNIYKQNVTGDGDEEMWSFNSKEFKAKIYATFVGKKLPVGKDMSVRKINVVGNTVKYLAGIAHQIEGTIFDLSESSGIVNSNFGNGAMTMVDRKQHHQFYYVSSNKKYIYQDNIGDFGICEAYDLEKDPLELCSLKTTYKDLPEDLKKYYEDYKKNRPIFSMKVWLSNVNSYVNFNALKFYYNNPIKILRFVKKRLSLFR